MNTVDWRLAPEPVGFLPGYGALVEWSVVAGALPRAEAPALHRLAGREPAAPEAAVRRARRLREQLYRTLAALAAGAAPAERDLTRVAAAYATAVRSARPRAGPSVLLLEWPDEPPLDRPLWPVAVDAWQLATSDAVARLNLCPGDGCGWLVLDQSRSGTRPWCSMEGCGSRMKMRRLMRARARG